MAIFFRYCGTSAPPVLTSTENIMTVIFVSDDSIGNEGFAASYVALNASTSEYQKYYRSYRHFLFKCEITSKT